MGDAVTVTVTVTVTSVSPPTGAEVADGEAALAAHPAMVTRPMTAAVRAPR